MIQFKRKEILVLMMFLGSFKNFLFIQILTIGIHLVYIRVDIVTFHKDELKNFINMRIGT